MPEFRKSFATESLRILLPSLSWKPGSIPAKHDLSKTTCIRWRRGCSGTFCGKVSAPQRSEICLLSGLLVLEGPQQLAMNMEEFELLRCLGMQCPPLPFLNSFPSEERHIPSYNFIDKGL